MKYEFEMSLGGELTYFLGLQVKQMEDIIFLSQSKYAKSIVKKFGLDNASPKRTHASTYVKVAKGENRVNVDQSLYRSMIGILLYLITIRHGITFYVGYCDTDWDGSIDNRDNTSDGCFFLGNNLISLLIKKKKYVSSSTIEDEYIDSGSSCT
ncbi:uncharacterized mitochondrial protein AtMg00810-like [Lathyrus oleraceus]|uniref:uncharacterized mitochondrial protein AtMg00810-like n=1 Tax=Pisum sativum TaxID=3888 RepID=UPI0021CE8A55|nr:uncharacterized mitochondrial protein AtMg00810-like [Pisum sativum]